MEIVERLNGDYPVNQGIALPIILAFVLHISRDAVDDDLVVSHGNNGRVGE